MAVGDELTIHVPSSTTELRLAVPDLRSFLETTTPEHGLGNDSLSLLRKLLEAADHNIDSEPQQDEPDLLLVDNAIVDTNNDVQALSASDGNEEDIVEELEEEDDESTVVNENGKRVLAGPQTPVPPKRPMLAPLDIQRSRSLSSTPSTYTPTLVNSASTSRFATPTKSGSSEGPCSTSSSALRIRVPSLAAFRSQRALPSPSLPTEPSSRTLRSQSRPRPQGAGDGQPEVQELRVLVLPPLPPPPPPLGGRGHPPQNNSKQRPMFLPTASETGQLTAIDTHINFISCLSCVNVLDPEYRSKVFAIRDFLLGASHSSISFLQLTSINSDSDIKGLFDLINLEGTQRAVGEFAKFYTHLALGVRYYKLNTVEKKTKTAITKLWMKASGMSRGKIQDLIEYGTKISALVAAGSPLIMVHMACIGNFSTFVKVKTPDALYTACSWLIDTMSSDCKLGTIVTEKIIKCIAFIAKTLTFPIPTYDLTPGGFINSHLIIETDKFFQKLCKECIVLHPRSNSTWDYMNTFYHPYQELIKEGPFSTTSESQQTVDVIPNTIPPRIRDEPQEFHRFDFPEAFEITMGFSMPQLLKQKLKIKDEKRHTKTEELREIAQKCQDAAPCTFEDLLARIAKIHGKNGSRVSKKEYLYLSNNLMKSKKCIRLQAKKKEFLGFVLTDMPHRIKAPLFEQVLAAAGLGQFQATSSNVPGLKFVSYHLDWYFRYGTNPTSLPEGVHPSRAVSQKKRKINYRSLTVHCSAELLNNEALFVHLTALLEEFFAYISEALKFYLPSVHEELESIIEVLPLNGSSPFHPFSGVVLNINCATNIHRDPKDQTLCMVIPFGNFAGGELVLEELGLVLQLAHGDVVAFLSGKISHFNLHFHGQRGSLVLHSDSHLTHWNKTKQAFTDIVS
ncbi:hypothetical protein SCHPADRAFT_941756 [Schizopora paradoxa]|uniref:Uncharacterized protein n=1 Tax=Schizopora paradoxa TaxID=27342 RepID=A0A0H2RIF7_9AGAM|nr:hypothetical protein SCHPADRAFT_941756 [Schizopora paradoxa]